MGGALRIPLSTAADTMLDALRQATGSPALTTLDGATLLGERAALRGMTVPSLISANGCCHLLEAADDRIALNLARPSDVEMLPALFECDGSDLCDSGALAARIRTIDAAALTARGRLMGLAIAREGEQTGILPVTATVSGMPFVGSPIATELVSGKMIAPGRIRPRVLDLSALWAGPLAAHLLWLAGAEVIRVEDRRRPDAMRQGDAVLFGLLNQGKASIALDLGATEDQNALLALIAAADIVIEAARPRALFQLGIDAASLAERVPGLVWVSITGYGAMGEAAGWIGFGDDCGVAGGLSAIFRDVTGHAGFVGDAIADPLTGIAAALVAWTRWRSGRGGRLGLAMRDVVAHCLQTERACDAAAWEGSLRAWFSARGQPFPSVQRRAMTAPLSTLGADTERCLTYAAHLR